MTEPILVAENLCVDVAAQHGTVRILDSVSLSVNPYQTLGLVGESGSGKSMTASALMRLLPPAAKLTSGSVKLEGVDLASLSEKQMRAVRGSKIGMIFQEPMTALDPTFSVGAQVAQTVQVHTGVSRKDAWAKAVNMLERVGIPSAARRANDHPHHFSGGQRQRVVIAMALVGESKLLLADEPTTALDVTVQAQILDLLKELRDERGLGMIFISHDLGVISDICDEVGVMYKGEIVERGDIFEVMYAPQHEYTRQLLEAARETSGMKKELS